MGHPTTRVEALALANNRFSLLGQAIRGMRQLRRARQALLSSTLIGLNIPHQDAQWQAVPRLHDVPFNQFAEVRWMPGYLSIPPAQTTSQCGPVVRVPRFHPSTVFDYT